MVGPNIFLTLIAGAALASLIWKFSPPSLDGVQIFGLCLMLAGFVLWTIARFQLDKSFTVTAQAKQLVTHGLYSKFRNPIYVFGSCTIAGLILALDHPRWLMVFAAVIPMQIRRSRKEARVLEASFGDDYRAYRAKTWF